MSKNTQSPLPEWELYRHLFVRKQIAPKTVLLKEGETSKTAFFVEQGCLRLWFNHQGKDITFQFFFEGDGVSSIESFRTGKPGLFTLESIEPTVVLTLSKKHFDFIIDDNPKIRRQIEEHTFERLVFYQQLFLSRIRDNPQKRYQELIRQYPKILQRVPQHYIASYLGITPVSLSRIRNRR